jgi:hypothetical protein
MGCCPDEGNFAHITVLSASLLAVCTLSMVAHI